MVHLIFSAFVLCAALFAVSAEAYSGPVPMRLVSTKDQIPDGIFLRRLLSKDDLFRLGEISGCSGVNANSQGYWFMPTEAGDPLGVTFNQCTLGEWARDSY